jgi:DNA mismatch repair protein MutL
MSDKIIILDENTINQIAAGEVIEQPSSVIKELVENSMDAGARHISVSIKEAGLKEIKVTDDGHGIDEENIEKAFSRYGTSKLNTIDDLYSLNTMGFRGEALASIASVSKVQISSRTKDYEFGITLGIEGGNITGKKADTLNIGTSIKVKDLFYNTPVRQKFLRSSLRETRDIIDIVEKLALSRPDIAFNLQVDGRLVFKTRGNNNIKELVAQILTYDIGKEMLPLEVDVEGIRIHGLVGNYNIYRGNRENIIFFINSRYVISNSLSKALEDAYKNRLPINKYPVGIIYLEIPQYIIEVNIHPRKMSVKIDQEEKIASLITEGVETLLIQTNSQRNRQPANIIADYINESGKAAVKETVLDTKEEMTYKVNKENNVDNISPSEITKEEQLSFYAEAKSDNPFSDMEVMGNISNTYIVANMNDTLYIIDQHAAHERINYEEAVKEFKTTGFKTQMLLEPYILSLGKRDFSMIVENIDKLLDYGVLLETFGEDAFLIRGLPLNIIGEEASREFMIELIDSFENKDVEHIKDLMLEKAACSRSVKAGNYINKNELKALIERLGMSEFPFTCPHGRPTFLKFNLVDLEKMFLRSK